MAKGKIFLVPFPFDDVSATKVRPAVCLTEPIGVYRHVVLAFITSQVPADSVDPDLALDPSLFCSNRITGGMYNSITSVGNTAYRNATA